MRAVVEMSGKWSSLQYEWTLNGERFGQNSAQVRLPAISTGDEIGLRVIPFHGSSGGTPFEVGSVVRNQKPQIQSVSIDRNGEGSSAEGSRAIWRAVVAAEDPDHDRLEFEYRWLVNGSESDVEEEFFPAGDLRRGDQVEVRARVSDGRLWSAPGRSGEIEVGNSLPLIVSIPPRPDPTGYFHYVVDARDSGGDEKLRFSLRKSPRGMRIDEARGEVTWRPALDQAGRHDVEIVVRDEDGGEATQEFSLALITNSDSAPGPASPN